MPYCHQQASSETSLERDGLRLNLPAQNDATASPVSAFFTNMVALSPARYSNPWADYDERIGGSFSMWSIRSPRFFPLAVHPR